jgi:hypothetical protein
MVIQFPLSGPVQRRQVPKIGIVRQPGKRKTSDCTLGNQEQVWLLKLNDLSGQNHVFVSSPSSTSNSAATSK